MTAWTSEEEQRRRRRQRILRGLLLGGAAIGLPAVINATIARQARRIAGSALGTLVASIITAASAAPTSCGGAYNPFLIRVAAVLGGLGLVVLAVAAAVWLFRHLFL